MIDFRRHISIFLACNLLIVALIAAPKIEIIVPVFPNQQEISTGDQVKLQGCTKNELTSSQQNIEISLKKKTIHYFSGFIDTVVLRIGANNRTSNDLLINSGAIQSVLKKLIFPFHTFW